ncbi:galactose oxidase/kelch repeat superfamily protein [Striga asiatica]|uniref:Galactose oxidase/kelch repeat superfamily protein n=1 Tax=Striga asiatica TaxID=4170 RepID=A0A5A7RID7_STRAF|nr:galactose oxidase/kelch repeat superfamily protein [Striga asiatica]
MQFLTLTAATSFIAAAAATSFIAAARGSDPSTDPLPFRYTPQTSDSATNPQITPQEAELGIGGRDKSSAVGGAGDEMASGMGRAIGDDHRPGSAAAEEGRKGEN